MNATTTDTATIRTDGFLHIATCDGTCGLIEQPYAWGALVAVCFHTAMRDAVKGI